MQHPVSERTGLKMVDYLLPGDIIVSQHQNRVFKDRVSDVRFVRDGKVHVDLNDGTALRICDEGQRVPVLISH